MKKTIFLILFMFFSTIPVHPITSDAVSDLTTLARYFPSTSPLYTAFYVNDETIDTLDIPLNQIAVNIGFDDYFEGKGPLRWALDYLADDMVDGETFNSIYRPWLGETIAIGALTPETLVYGEYVDGGDTTWLIVVEVKDRDLAEKHMNKVIARGEGIFSYFKDYVKTDVDGYPLYRPLGIRKYDTTFLLMDDALLIRTSSIQPETILPNYDKTLADVDGFEDTFRRLPLDDYMLVTYYDPSAFAPYADEYETEIRVNTIVAEDVNTKEALEALGPQVLGFTVLNDLSFTFDVATHVNDPEGLKAAGIPIVTSEPIDLSFVEHLPSDTQFFVQDSGLGLGVHQVLVLMQETGNYAERYYGDSYQQEYYDDMALIMRGIFGGLQQNSPATVSANHILFGRQRWGTSRSVGLLLEVSNSSEVMGMIPALLTEQDMPYIENNGEFELPHVAGLAEDENLTVHVLAEDNLLIVGTGHAVRDDLDTSTNSLADDPAYQRAASLFVPDAQIIGYELGLYGIFESYSISTTYDEDGTGIVRFVVRVND